MPPTPLRRFVDDVLRVPVETRTVRSTSVGRVLEVVAEDGTTWYAKRFLVPAHYVGEVKAHRTWTGPIRDRAPALVAASPSLRAVVVTAVPGAPPEPLRSGHFLQAGRLLQAFHGSIETRAEVVAKRTLLRLERELTRCGRLDVDVDEAWVRRHVGAVRDLGPLPVVPCHGDYLPHNWMVDATGTLRVIDFAEAHLDAAAYDVTRLHFGPGWDSPTSVGAFLRGYGRPMLEAEIAFVDAHLAVNALAAITWGTLNDVESVRARGREVLAALRDGHRFRPQVWRGQLAALRNPTWGSGAVRGSQVES